MHGGLVKSTFSTDKLSHTSLVMYVHYCYLGMLSTCSLCTDGVTMVTVMISAYIPVTSMDIGSVASYTVANVFSQK